MAPTFRERIPSWFAWVPPSARPRLEEGTSLPLFRALLLTGGTVYLSWWFVVQFLLKGSFNPLGSRLLVVGFFYGAFALTYVSRAACERIASLFDAAAWVLTLHYFYLLYGNGGQRDWVVGTYFCVVAINACIQRRRSMLAYNALVVLLGLGTIYLLPMLGETLFLSGLVTIGAISYAGLHHRFNLLAQLARSTQRFQSLFDATFEAVLVHDHGRILDANAAAGRLFGCERSALIGRNITSLWTDGPTEWAENDHFDVSRQEADGTRLYLEVAVKEHLYSGRPLSLMALRDVSDRRRAEAERSLLIQAEVGRAAAEEAVRKREEFISITAHELRTPLTSLQLHVQRLISSSIGEPWTSKLDACERQVKRLNRLTQGLLDLSRLDMRRLSLEPEWLDLDQLVREVVGGFADEVRRAHCEVDIDSAPGLRVWADRLRIEQVLGNLLRNALLYGRGKPILIETIGESETVKLKVHDQGIGIEPENQARVFEQFERAVSARHYGGLGIGLYIARQITRAHGGTISVTSVPGEGSTFTVELPRRHLELGQDGFQSEPRADS